MSYPGIPSVPVTEVPSPLPEDLAVLDVREDVEWQHGHIDGALHIPLGELVSRRDEVPYGTVLVVCAVGGRSAQAVQYLRANELDAVNLTGGMVDWAAEGRPMVSDLGGDPRVV